MSLRKLASGISFTLFLFPALPVNAAPTPGPEMIQSPKDKHHYRTLRLDNQLQVVLVQDPGATHAAAAVSVQAGSAQNPSDAQGVAHFTEHLVFLGSQKYPDPNGFNAFMGNVGGSWNATTGVDQTEYYFKVPSEALPEALSRLGATLATPLFDTDYVDRERHAVDAEYRMWLDADTLRLYEALGKAFDPSHPLARFSTGNLQTLSGEPAALRQQVMTFYQAHYSANRMAVVVSGPQSLDALQQYVVDSFSAMPDRQLPAPRIEERLAGPGILPATLAFKPLKPTHEVRFLFPVENAQSDLRAHSERFLFAILNRTGPGSLQAQLRAAGLGLSAQAQVAYWRSNETLISIKVTLPSDRKPELDRIQASVFAYLDLVRSKGLEAWRYDEIAKIASQQFAEFSQSDPLSWVRRILRNTQQYEGRDLLYGPYRMEGFDPERVTAMLDAMTPANLMRVYIDPKAETDRKGTWFAAPYQLQRVSNWPLAMAEQGLALSAPNPYLATDLKVLDVNANRPQLAVDTPGLRLWYRPEHQFNTPKSTWNIELQSPVVPGVREHVMRSLLVMSVRDAFQPTAQQASLAGMGAGINLTETGMAFSIEGFRQHQTLLIDKLMQAFATTDIESEVFQRAVTRLQRRWAKENRELLINDTANTLGLALYPANWLPAESLAAMKGVDLQGFNAWRREWLSQLHVDAMVVGNVGSDDVHAMSQRIQARLRPTLRASDIPQISPRTFASGLPAMRPQTDSKDSALLLHLSQPSRDVAARADVMLLGQLIRSPFYISLRTEQQLGYAVSASSHSDWRKPGLNLLIQSNAYGSEVLEARTERFLTTMDAQLAHLSERKVAESRGALVANLSRRDESSSALLNRYWADLKQNDLTFSGRQQLIAAVQNRTPEQLAAAWRRLRSGPALRIVSDPGVPANFSAFKRTPTALLAPDTAAQSATVEVPAAAKDPA